MAVDRRSGSSTRNDKRPQRFGDKKSTFTDKKGPASGKIGGGRKGLRTDKKTYDFTSEKDSPREPKYDVEVHEEQLGDNDKLEGRNSVMEALKANRTINKLFVVKGEREGSIRQIIAIARQKGIIITEVEKNVLDSMSTSRSHQGVIAFVSVKEYVEVDDILQAAQEKGQPPFLIILDEITDPHNFGAILRTANAVGAHGVIIPKRRAIGLTSAVSKASAGAVEYVPVSRVTNIAQTIEYLKKNNVWVVGTDATGDKAFFESDLKGPIALVVGSEGEGMGKLIREKCDFVVNIPMQGEISSLNASVAAAIVMYEILKQRGRS
jgi:23S rRNA (guanosine2251-2'-O)-methyltransferase